MKKLFFSLVAATMAATASFAQGSLLATLSHDGEISVFYGAGALKTAVESAVAGDVITLSSGQFMAIDITKPITLRGAGMSVNNDPQNVHESTIIQGAFSINIEGEQTGRLNMEGLYINNDLNIKGTLSNAQFLKCRFSNFWGNDNSVIENTTLIHCRIYKGLRLTGNSNAYFINCVVCGPFNSSESTIEFDNCFVKYDNGFYWDGANNTNQPIHIANAYYKNCIIQSTGINGPSHIIPSSCTAFNCIGLGVSSIFDNLKDKNSTNIFIDDITKVFKTYNKTDNGTYIADNDTFELTDEAISTYLGTDGTQVGIYGSNLPYNEEPTIPQITKCNVASKSTADGKLSVDIEVKAAEY